jgi:formiminotetrahydrofolate cyclodeaminase
MTAELSSLSLRDFTAALASEAPAPGGGSASAAAGAAGAALLAMVVRLTLGKEKYRDAWGELEPLLSKLDTAQKRLLELIEEDTGAYAAVVAARRRPKDTPEEKAVREKAVEQATILATTVPMQTAFFAREALKLAPAVAQKGNPNAASDAWVASLLLHAAILGALANVRINLDGVKDPELKRGFSEDARDVEKAAAEHLETLHSLAKTRGLVG